MTKNLYKMVLAAGILLIAAGCGKKTELVTPAQNNPGASQNLAPQQPAAAQNTANKPPAKECTQEPVATDIGRDAYPIADKYKHLQFLGQLFTASDCGNERLSKIFGVKGDQYTLGASITLDPGLYAQFSMILKNVGFTCTSKEPESSCTRWQLDKTVKLEDILKLKPFADKIKQDDCYICG